MWRPSIHLGEEVVRHLGPASTLLWHGHLCLWGDWSVSVFFQDLNVLYFILFMISIFTCQQNMFGKNRQIIIKSRVTMTHGLALILSIRCGVTPGESNENPGWYEGKWMSLSLDYDFIVFPGVEWSAEHQHGDGLVPLYCGWILWLLEIWGGKVLPLCGRMIFIM